MKGYVKAFWTGVGSAFIATSIAQFAPSLSLYVIFFAIMAIIFGFIAFAMALNYAMEN